MLGEQLLNNIIKLKESYPRELQNLYWIRDEQYINKIMIGFDNSKNISNYNYGDIVKTTIFLDIKEYYDYNTRSHLYLQEKDNKGELSPIYLTKVQNGIPKTENGLVIDFVNMLIIKND